MTQRQLFKKYMQKKGNKKMTQGQIIMSILKSEKPYTHLDILRQTNILSFGKRVSELGEYGFRIISRKPKRCLYNYYLWCPVKLSDKKIDVLIANRRSNLYFTR